MKLTEDDIWINETDDSDSYFRTPNRLVYCPQLTGVRTLEEAKQLKQQILENQEKAEKWKEFTKEYVDYSPLTKDEDGNTILQTGKLRPGVQEQIFDNKKKADLVPHLEIEIQILQKICAKHYEENERLKEGRGELLVTLLDETKKQM